MVQTGKMAALEVTDLHLEAQRGSIWCKRFRALNSELNLMTIKFPYILKVYDSSLSDSVVGKKV